MASPTTSLPILLLLTFSTLSLTFPDQPNPPSLAIASLAAIIESSTPPSTLPTYYIDNHASAPVPALVVTGLHEGAVTAASSSLLLLEQVGLVAARSLKPTVTIAQTTRTSMTNRTSNATGRPGNNKTTNTIGSIIIMSSTGNSTAIRVGSSSATVLPPEPVFTQARPRSEAGRRGGRGMGMVGVLVVVGMGVWGGMVVL